MTEENTEREQPRTTHHENKKSKSNTQKPLLLLAVAVALVGVGFFGGMSYQKGHQKTKAGGMMTGVNGAPGGFSGQRGGGRRRAAFGQVTAISATSISIAEQTGTNATFAISSATTFTDNGQPTTSSAITVGENVAVIANPSDATQASRIMVNPSFGDGSTPPSTDNIQTN